MIKWLCIENTTKMTELFKEIYLPQIWFKKKSNCVFIPN